MALTAVITGGSSGIGAATASALADAGYRVVVAARRMDRLAEVAARTGGTAVEVDVLSQESVDRFVGSVDSCDVLVNCAGAAVGADLIENSAPADWSRSFEVNVVGAVRVTRGLLPLLRRSPQASILTITSTAGYVCYESGGTYVAAKHATAAFVETLRLELCGEPIRVIDIAPGMVHTEEFALNRFDGDADRAAAVYRDVDRPLEAGDVARCVVDVLALPHHVNVDRLIVRPLAQAAQHKLHRGDLFTT